MEKPAGKIASGWNKSSLHAYPPPAPLCPCYPSHIPCTLPNLCSTLVFWSSPHMTPLMHFLIHSPIQQKLLTCLQAWNLQLPASVSIDFGCGKLEVIAFNGYGIQLTMATMTAGIAVAKQYGHSLLV